MVFSKSDDLLDLKFIESKYEVVSYTKRKTIKINDEGVLVYKIPYTEQWDVYPIILARYAIGYLGLYLENDKKDDLDTFFSQVNWLYNNLKIKNNIGIWEHHYRVPFFKNFHLPWVHGLGQALGMVALLKAYEITEEQKYLEASTSVLNSFDASIKESGVKFVDKNQQIWYEEYALLPPPHVLNGFITILFALHEFNRVTGSEKANNLFKGGLVTVEQNLELYDMGYWSMYDLLRGYPATRNYHRLHVWQLDVLNKITDLDLFKDYAIKWDRYQSKSANIKKASLVRGITHLKRYGIVNCINRYRNKKNWEK